jgi:DNA-binding NtrC family response regulator
MNQSSSYKILVVEDDAAERSALERLLVGDGYKVHTVDSANKAVGYIEESIDFVVTDLQLNDDLTGIDLLKHWKLREPNVMFLIVTGFGTVNSAIEAIRAGAYHYLTKPIDPNAILLLLKNMVREREQSRKVQMLEERLDEKFALNNLVGNSPLMQQVGDLIRRSAQTLSTVLILGESGTGKELVAQAIHQNSPRKAGPFIAINCAAIPATLVESELFGHEKGSFTGATERRVGRFEAAHGGTLLIDEIGEFELGLQVKLLRALETRIINRVGGQKDIKVDTRVLAATSRDIRAMMAQGKFREDLYYRLNVITIELPPLRQRPEDIPLLVRRFMDALNQQYKTNVQTINPEVLDIFQHYNWPGNVRELMNVIERMMVLANKPALETEDIPTYIHKEITGRSANDAAPSRPTGPGKAALAGHAPIITLEDMEYRAILAALKHFNNNRTRAAKALGISLRTLQRKLGSKSGDFPQEPEKSMKSQTS